MHILSHKIVIYHHLQEAMLLSEVLMFRYYIMSHFNTIKNGAQHKI